MNARPRITVATTPTSWLHRARDLCAGPRGERPRLLGPGAAAADTGAVTEQAAERYRHLPPPVRLEDTVAVTDTDPVPDPDGGRDPERDFMLRYAG